MSKPHWLAIALILVAGIVRADITVHVKNCTIDSFQVQSYDAKDSVKAVAASNKTFHNEQSGATLSLQCAGEGKGYCQMIILELDKSIPCSKTAKNGSSQFHLDSDKWAVITGTEAEGSVCKTLITVNVDSEPACQ